MTSARALVFALVACLMLAGSAAPARAQGNDAAAAAMEEAANAFWDQADAATDPVKKREAFVAAARAYEEAHRLAARFERIRSAASAWKNAGDDARAADDLELALGQPAPDADRVEMERLLARLDATLGRILFGGPPGARFTVDDRTYDPGQTARRTPGRVVVRAALANGTAVERAVDVVAGARVTVDFTEQRASSASPSPSPSPPPSSTVDATPTATIVGATLLATGAAGGIATAIIAGFGYAADDEADDAAPGAPAVDDAIALQRAAWAVGVPSAVVGVAGLVILVVDAATADPAPAVASRVGVCAGPATLGVGLCGRF